MRNISKAATGIIAAAAGAIVGCILYFIFIAIF